MQSELDDGFRIKTLKMGNGINPKVVSNQTISQS